MKKIIGLIFLLASGASSLTANAEKPAKHVKETERHHFEGTKLKGNFKKPELSYIYQRKGLRAEQIIEFPAEFNEEIRNASRHY